MNDEAAGAGRDRGEVDLRREAGSLAEHHVAVACIGACVAGAIAAVCSDDDVVEAVAVDVAGGGYRIAGEVIDLLAMDDEAPVAGRDRGEIDLRRKAAGVAEHDIAVAGRGACVAGAIPTKCPDDQVVEAVTVDVARGNRTTGYIAAILAMDEEAAVAGRDRGEVDLRRKAASVTEHHVAVTREDAGVAGAIAVASPDDEVVKAVAVDVTGRGYRKAGLIRRLLAMDDEAAVAGRDRAEVDLRRKPRGLAEHHVAVACAGAGVVGTVAVQGSDDDVVEAVAVEIAGRGDRIAGVIARVLAMNDEAAGAGGHIHQIDRHVLRSVSLAKLWEVTADAAPRPMSPRLPAGCARRPARASKPLVTGHCRGSSNENGWNSIQPVGWESGRPRRGG